MFDLAWSEIALIAVVAVVVIGPKDLPDAVRGVAKGIQKLRRMAGQFQGQLDEVVREAKLEDVRQSINEIRNFDFKGEIEKHVDADGSLRKTMAEDPIKDADPFGVKAPYTPDATVAGPVTPEHPAVTEAPAAVAVDAPAFIPPEEAAKAAPVILPPVPEVAVRDVPPPPSFLPPAAVEEAELKLAQAGSAPAAVAEAPVVSLEEAASLPAAETEKQALAKDEMAVEAGQVPLEKAAAEHVSSRGGSLEDPLKTHVAAGEKPDAKPATQS